MVDQAWIKECKALLAAIEKEWPGDAGNCSALRPLILELESQISGIGGKDLVPMSKDEVREFFKERTESKRKIDQVFG